MCTFARYLVLLVVSGGIIAAALALAGAASATTTATQSPSIVATPTIKAHPAPNATPGHLWHHGMWHLQDLEPGYTR